MYMCPDCDTRYRGQQRCDECNTWAAALVPEGCARAANPVTCTRINDGFTSFSDS